MIKWINVTDENPPLTQNVWVKSRTTGIAKACRLHDGKYLPHGYKQTYFQDVYEWAYIVDYSQNGESKILDALLEEIGIKKPECLEIGAGDGYHLSNTRYFIDKGCGVKMINLDNRGNSEVKQLFITDKNIEDIIWHDYNLVSIDVDGNDYWLLDSILKFTQPDVICFEVNSQLPLDECITMPYNESHTWDGSWFYGMSYLAGCKLCKTHGYTIYTVVNNTNIIAVRNIHKITPELYSFGLTKSHPETKPINEFQKL